MGIWREREERDKLMEMLRNRGEEAGERAWIAEAEEGELQIYLGRRRRRAYARNNMSLFSLPLSLPPLWGRRVSGNGAHGRKNPRREGREKL